MQRYKEENGLTNDATACLQLIVQQLKAQENSKRMMKLLETMSTEQFLKLSGEGLDLIKEELQEKGKQ